MKKAFFIALTVLAIVCIPGSVAYSANDPVVSEGITQSSLASMAADFEASGDNKDEFFMKAWDEYATGNINKSLAMCEFYLSKKNVTESLSARFLFLKATIQAKKGLALESIDTYQRANELFVELESYGNIYRVNLCLAKIYMNVGDYGLAAAILDSSYDIADEFQIGLGYYLQLKSHLSFLEGDYWGALRFIGKSHAEYEREGNKKGAVDSMSSIGFLKMLTGDFEGGLAATQLAEEEIMQINSQGKHYFTLLNNLLYQRCHGMSIATTEMQIKKRIALNGDNDLQMMLDFVMHFDCNSIKKADDPSRYGETSPTIPPNAENGQ